MSDAMRDPRRIRPSRRGLLGGACAALLAPGHTWDVTSEQQAGLKDHAARGGLVFGAAIGLDNFPLPDCRALYRRETSAITTDQALKFATLRPARDVFDFGPADAVVGWARREGLLVRGHNLIWNDYNSPWLERLSGNEIERVFDEHIERVVSRYVGQIDTWDVVNEPFWPGFGEPGGYRRGPWYAALGPGYVQRALRRVRSIDKTAKLCVNEAQVDNDHAWGRTTRPCLARLVHELRQQDVPFDVLGLQCHLRPAWPHDYDRFADYMRELAQNRIELHITEFDVDDSSFPDAIETRDTMVAAFADGFLKAVLPVRDITTFVTWELADRWSYMRELAAAAHPGATRTPRPLPFDDALSRKPLWYTLARNFDARRTA